jgi:ComF family protein
VFLQIKSGVLMVSATFSKGVWPVWLRTALSVLSRGALAALYYAADIALPPICVSCHVQIEAHGLLCPVCWWKIDFIRPPVCDRLGLPLPYCYEERPVSNVALANPPLFDRARAAAHYDGVLRSLIHGMKFLDRHEVTPLFGRMLAEAARDLAPDADVIVPTPLSRARLASRRFNQAAMLAQALGRETGLPVELMALRRTRSTASQVGLGVAGRQSNVEGAFAVASRRRGRIAGKRVLLVDDVITTGATAGACAVALKQAGATGVDVVALALVAVEHGGGDERGRENGFGVGRVP